MCPQDKMGIQVIDHKKILSKHQIQKVKSSVTNFLATLTSTTETAHQKVETFLKEKVLPSITFQEGSGSAYNDVMFQKDPTTGHDQIIFKELTVVQTPSKDDLKKKLKTKLHERTCLRKVNDDEKSRLWKTCERLKKYTPGNVTIPTPSQIKEQRAIFEEMLEKMPNSAFREYVRDCVNV